VRERSKLVLEKAKKNQLKHFTVDMSKFHDVASFVVSIIKVGIAPAPRDAADGQPARLRARLCRDSSPRPLAAL
jgi:hypothetical protein